MKLVINVGYIRFTALGKTLYLSDFSRGIGPVAHHVGMNIVGMNLIYHDKQNYAALMNYEHFDFYQRNLAKAGMKDIEFITMHRVFFPSLRKTVDTRPKTYPGHLFINDAVHGDVKGYAVFGRMNTDPPLMSPYQVSSVYDTIEKAREALNWLKHEHVHLPDGRIGRYC